MKNKHTFKGAFKKMQYLRSVKKAGKFLISVQERDIVLPSTTEICLRFRQLVPSMKTTARVLKQNLEFGAKFGSPVPC